MARARDLRADVLLVTALLATLAGAALVAQQGPVAAMYGDDEKREKELAPSFLTIERPAAGKAVSPLRVYLSAGDLERAFDTSAFRPDGAIIPTNTDLAITAASPGTQLVLIDRVRKHAEVMRDLEDQIAARRKQSPKSPGPEPGFLRVGLDSFVAELPRGAKQASGPFPRIVCLIPTDFSDGGAIDRRDLFTQDRVRKGISECLLALDAAGVRSVVMPLMGAASSRTQAKDPIYEGQRLLKECRLLNSVAGISLGIHDFVPGRRNVREIGLVQWDQEVVGMFSVPGVRGFSDTARAAYQLYARQISEAFNKGLAGERLTPSDVGNNCVATFNGK